MWLELAQNLTERNIRNLGETYLVLLNLGLGRKLSVLHFYIAQPR